jgi:hypothetical protein
MKLRFIARDRAAAYHAAIRAAAVLTAGVILSGPLALLVVDLVHPQPPWQDAATFAAAYHWIQLLPYIGGFALIGGFVALMAALHASATPALRSRANVALSLTAAFAALIVLNYVLQTTFVPARIDPLHPEDAPIVAAVTMANPSSLAWALEMWGYAVLGIATWMIAPIFAGDRLERATSAAFVANGVVSAIGAVATAVAPSWPMTVAGIASFALWNLLVVVMAVLVIVVMVRRTKALGL